MDRTKHFSDLRHDYPEFIYDSFSVKITGRDITVQFKFIQSRDIVFEPFVIFRDCGIKEDSIKDLESAFFNLGMIELASYYKACCSPVIRIKAGALDAYQAIFWKKIIYRGLGEFLYKNNINTSESELFELLVDSSREYPPSQKRLKEEVIIPVGGGKDSVVTLEILSAMNGLPLILNPREASTESVKIAGYDRYLKIERKIDPLLLELNKKGYLNGHTPFSALLAFVSAASSLMQGKKYIALSNENSANEGNAFFSGIEINHQYSKSFEAEKSLHDYIRKYISEELYYFSFLRPLNELAIAKIFSQYEDHYSTFKSCNAGSKDNIWCQKCPKCLFTYIILSPFIPDDKLMKIFGTDLLNERELESVFLELCGFKGIKPFECVGTVSEVNAALARKLELHKGKILSYLLGVYADKSTVDTKSYLEKLPELLKEFSPDNLLPPDFKKILEEHL
jgi:hypothetical protein